MNMEKSLLSIFLNLEKRNKAKSHLRKIAIDDNLNETTDPGEILSSLRNFYSPMYKRQSNKTENECLEHLENLNLPTGMLGGSAHYGE